MSENVSTCAADTIEMLDETTRAISKLSIPNETRQRVSLTLLFASIAQARSACVLLSIDPENNSLAALILFRSQIDQMMRGVFFAGPATTKEFDHFIEKDKLPTRNKKLLGPKSIASLAEDFYGWGTKKRVSTMVQNHWKELSGFTHGGKALITWYLDTDSIGPGVPNDQFLMVLTNALVLAVIAASVAMTMANNFEDNDLQSSLRGWHAKQREFFAVWTPQGDAAEAAAAVTDCDG